MGNADLASREYWDRTWTGAAPHDYEGPVYGFHPLFSRVLPRGPGLRLLELGSARGFTLTYLHKEFGYEVFGVDSSHEGIEVAREHCRRNGVPATLYEGDLFDVDFPGTFDVVYSGGLVEHFHDLDRVIRRHMELVAPGGTLLLGVPNLLGLHAPLMRRLLPEMYAVHRKASCSPWTIRSAIRRADPRWRVVHCAFGETFRFFYPVPPWLGIAGRGFSKALRLAHMKHLGNRWLSPDAYVVARRPARGAGPPR